MLDIAAGILIAAFVIGLFLFGLMALDESVRPSFLGDSEHLQAIGVIFIMVSVALAVWLVFIRTGLVSIFGDA